MAKRTIWIVVFLGALVILVACGGQKRFHDADLPSPASYQAHFGDMDGDGDGLVTRTEFKGHFSHAEGRVFDALDLNKDGVVDHDEWHQFKKAHGMKHHAN